MTLCAACGREKHVGHMVDGDFVCGACDPAGSVAKHVSRGNGRRWR